MDTKKYRTTLLGEPISESEKFLRAKDITELCCISRAMIYKLMSAHKFPPSHRIAGDRIAGDRVVWLATDINIWRSMTPAHFQDRFGEQLKAHAEGAAA